MTKHHKEPHGCLACAEVNQGFEYTNEELGLKVCTCGKRGKVLDLQEAFDYIKHLTRKVSEEELDAAVDRIFGIDVDDDPQPLDFDE